MSMDQWREVAEVERGRSLARDYYEALQMGHLNGELTFVVREIEECEIESDVASPDRFTSVLRMGSGAVKWTRDLFDEYTADVEPPLSDEGREEGILELDRLLSYWEFDLQRHEEISQLAAEIEVIAMSEKYMMRATVERARSIARGKVPDPAYLLHRAKELVMQDILVWKQACQQEQER